MKCYVLRWKIKRPDEILTLEDVKKGAASLEELVAQLTVEEMADLCVGTERLEEGGNVIGSSSACVPGATGDTTSALIEKRKIPNLILADGPAGLRLQTHFKTDKEGNKLPGGEQFGMEIAPFAKEATGRSAGLLPVLYGNPDCDDTCAVMGCGSYQENG